MSCCLCRLPFLPHRKRAYTALPAHKAPPGLFTSIQHAYFERARGFGQYMGSCYMDLVYLSSNLFVGEHSEPPMLMTISFEPQCNETCIVMHHTCMNLFRKAFNCEKNTRDHVWKLFAIEYALGYPLGGVDSGRWRDIDYEQTGEKVDTRSLWTPSNEAGMNVFDWKGLQGLGYDWLINRPDIFPRFYDKVSDERLSGLSADARGADVLAQLPSGVLRRVAGYLDARGLAHLSAACRFMRFVALTEWQTLARAVVYSLGWAIPTSIEMNDTGDRKSPLAPIVYAGAAGDWMLYLSHVHRTKSMRIRRWIWALCLEARRVAEDNFVDFEVLIEGSPAWKAVETSFETGWKMRPIMHSAVFGNKGR